MKKPLIVFIALLASVGAFSLSAVYGQNMGYTTTAKTNLAASGSVFVGKCYLSAINMFTDGNATATHNLNVTLYDSATGATGGIVAGPFKLFSGLYSDHMTWTAPLLFKNGIYAVLSGTGGTAIIEYAR